MTEEEPWIEIVVTYLEMRAPSSRMRCRPPLLGVPLQILRLSRPSVPFYRYLYETVGAPWRWYERRMLDDTELEALLTANHLDVIVLYAGGEPAGFAELHRHPGNDVELAYFGLMPHFIGHGLGRYFLETAVEMAWTPHPRTGTTRRVWLHTCTLDHPAALGLYQKIGFHPVAQDRKRMPDPMRAGQMPPYTGPLPIPYRDEL